MEAEEVPLTFEEALALFQERQAANPAHFRPGASEEEIKEANNRLPVPIPPAWEKMLRLSREFSAKGWETYSPDSIVMTDSDVMQQLYDKDDLEALGASQMVVASDYTGDFMTLDTPSLTSEGDCPVLWVSHGSGEEADRWASVAEFLQWIVSDPEGIHYGD